MEEFNLKTDRADVIVPAAEIFLIIAGIVKANPTFIKADQQRFGLVKQFRFSGFTRQISHRDQLPAIILQRGIG